jgi:transposase-like protein
MADDHQQDATFWIKETQRRGHALTAAQERGASADEIVRLQKACDEADGQREVAGNR